MTARHTPPDRNPPGRPGRKHARHAGDPVRGTHYFYAVARGDVDAPLLFEVVFDSVFARSGRTGRPTQVRVCDVADSKTYVMEFVSLRRTELEALQECRRAARRCLPHLVQEMTAAARNVLYQERTVARIEADIEACKQRQAAGGSS